jgi:hypothetical protein
VLYIICNTYILYAGYWMYMMLASHFGVGLKKAGQATVLSGTFFVLAVRFVVHS